MSPNHGNQLGGTPIIITGQCFDETSSITCCFGKIETSCMRGSNRDRSIRVMVGVVEYADESVTFYYHKLLYVCLAYLYFFVSVLDNLIYTQIY